MIRLIMSDFDGVILESNHAKTRAFERCFSIYPDHVAKIVNYHKENLAVSRFRKFVYIHETILNKVYDEQQKKATEKRFHEIVISEVLKCPEVPGAVNFLETYSKHAPIFIISATPISELESIVRQKGLSVFINKCFSASDGKSDVMAQILRNNNVRPEETIYFGDTNSDLNAAKVNKVPFIGRRDCEPLEGPMIGVIDTFNEIDRYLKINNDGDQGFIIDCPAARSGVRNSLKN